MNVLDGNQHLIIIPTDPKELASLLDNYAQDWSTVLNFLEEIAHKSGISLETDSVSKIMTVQYLED